MKIRPLFICSFFVLASCAAALGRAQDHRLRKRPDVFLQNFAGLVEECGDFQCEVAGNVWKFSEKFDSKMKFCVEIYPVRPQQGDVIYYLTYLQNVSDETIPNVFAPRDLRFVLSGHLVRRNFGRGPEMTTKKGPDLLPGHRIYLAKRMFLQNFSAEEEVWQRIDLEPFETYFLVLKPDSYHAEDEYYFDKSFTLYVNSFLPRDELELKRIKSWFTERSNSTGDDVYDFYLGDAAFGGDETLLKAPSTTRDEIQLTRLILEYLHDEGTMEAVTDFVESRPFPQKILMTYRLWTEGGNPQPPLPEGWEAKLLKLNEKFREIRENALNE